MYGGYRYVRGVGISRNERQVEHRLPLQLQEEAGAEVHVRADREMHTHPGAHGSLQGRDRALARRVQNQDLVQGLV